jgi:hypothetical protein
MRFRFVTIALKHLNCAHTDQYYCHVVENSDWHKKKIVMEIEAKNKRSLVTHSANEFFFICCFEISTDFMHLPYSRSPSPHSLRFILFAGKNKKL